MSNLVVMDSQSGNQTELLNRIRHNRSYQINLFGWDKSIKCILLYISLSIYIYIYICVYGYIYIYTSDKYLNYILLNLSNAL